MDATTGENIPIFSEEEEEDLENIKRRISSHPLYELLTQTHLDCLKLCQTSLGKMEEVVDAATHREIKKTIRTSISNHSDLDRFMQTYCMGLSELKEAMAEPLQETTTFVNAMNFELEELMTTYPSQTSSPTSSGKATTEEEISRAHRLVGTHNDQFIHSSSRERSGRPGERGRLMRYRQTKYDEGQT